MHLLIVSCARNADLFILGLLLVNDVKISKQ